MYMVQKRVDSKIKPVGKILSYFINILFNSYNYNHINIYAENFFMEFKNLEKENCNISKFVVFVLMIIHKQRISKRRFINNNSIYEIENTIINDSLIILWNDTNIKSIMNKINKLLEHKMDECYQTQHKQIYGCSLTINYDKITEINKNNALKIYENLNKLTRLNEFQQKEFELYYECENYLFCLCYYEKLF
jgi:hypothetical protein